MTISYTLTGAKWQQPTITWSFADSNYAADADRGVVFSHPITDDLQPLVQQVMQEWSAVSGLVFNQVADSNTVDIRIGFANLNTATTGHGIIGLTDYSFKGSLLLPDTLVSVEDPSQLPLISVNGTLTYQGYQTRLSQDLLHEVGHALGLGHSTDPLAVMYPILTTADRDLDVSDVAGIHALYPPTPVAVAGLHSQYIIANDSGSLYVQDLANRSGPKILSANTRIKFADGTGVFDTTGNAEEVARLYRAAFERSPDSGGEDFWTAQINAKTLTLDQVAMSFIASPEFQNTYGSLNNTQFIQTLYQNALGRPGDQNGVTYWQSQMNNGETRDQMLLNFSDSFENKAHTISTIGDRDLSEAYRLYQAAFNRTPDTPGLDVWTTQLDQGITPLQVAQSFVDSSEFAQLFAGLTTEGFVDHLYENALHRTADVTGEQYWVDQLNSGATKAQVLLNFSDSPENKIQTASVTHDAWVFVPS